DRADVRSRVIPGARQSGDRGISPGGSSEGPRRHARRCLHRHCARRRDPRYGCEFGALSMLIRLSGLLLRYFYLYRRSAARIMGILFWPVMDLLVWGFLTSYLQKVTLPASVLFLLGAVIFWDIFYSSQQAISLSITEEIWV